MKMKKARQDITLPLLTAGWCALGRSKWRGITQEDGEGSGQIGLCSQDSKKMKSKTCLRKIREKVTEQLKNK